MPLYEYICKECNNKYEVVLPLKEYESETECPLCGALGKKIFTSHIQRDEPVWLDDEVKDVLQDREDPATHPIETRCDYNRYLKENGIIAR